MDLVTMMQRSVTQKKILEKTLKKHETFCKKAEN
jgi:hypothetical protein